MILLNAFSTPLLMFSIGGPEVVVVILVVLLLFGAKRIPELAKGLGKGIREFKDASREIKKEIDNEAKEINKLDQKID